MPVFILQSSAASARERIPLSAPLPEYTTRPGLGPILCNSIVLLRRDFAVSLLEKVLSKMVAWRHAQRRAAAKDAIARGGALPRQRCAAPRLERIRP
jgi:hypothetical protein